MRPLGIIADNTRHSSLASRLRRKRFRIVRELIGLLEAPVRILDVGGTQKYWEMVGFLPTPDYQITLLNLHSERLTLPHFSSVRGDGRAMSAFSKGNFDLVFSNSVIEHVGGPEDQRRFADETRRVGRYYYVQTPNRGFPIEPHFLFPCFQYLPVGSRVWLLRHFPLGWHPKTPDYDAALRTVTGVRLLSARELASLFPGAALYKERVLGMTKSLAAYTAPRRIA